MGYPRVKQCCCGCTLETGSLIIGWVEIIYSILGILGYIILLIIGKNNEKAEDETVKDAAGLVSSFISLALSVLLVIGIRRKLPNYVNVWVIVNTIGTIMYSILLAVLSIMLMVNGAIGGGFAVLIIGFIVIMLSLYPVIVVSSYRKKLKEDNREAQIHV